MVDSVSVRFKNARVEKTSFNIRIQWNAGTACVSECVLKTLACRGLRVGPSKCLLSNHFLCCAKINAHYVIGRHELVTGKRNSTPDVSPPH